MKAIGVHLKNEVLYIQAYSTTTMGVSRLNGPVFIFERYNTLEIGQGLVRAFKECAENIPHKNYQISQEPEEEDAMLKAAGVKTWNAMMKSSKNVNAILKENNVTFTPYKYIGRNGYLPLNEKTITSDLTPENLGKSLLDAFERCE